MRVFFTLFLYAFIIGVSWGQSSTQRSSLHFLRGTSSANIREFNQMLENKGVSPLRNNYGTFGLSYQNRFNDFVIGFELYNNQGPTSTIRDYDITYRTTRLYLNVGYSFTEEGRFHLIHYMSLGSGFLNFEMLQREEPDNLSAFLQDPARGFILRQNNVHKGSQYLGDFLTEIGFQVGYDFDVPGFEESLEIIAKFGYSFSPFENAWSRRGIAFDNVQSGPFLRLGAGISLPDHNYFYRDAALSVHLLYGLHYTRPEQLNGYLDAFGFQPLAGRPNNWGFKILGENRGMLYGLDLYNLAMSGDASASQIQTLNSIRFYGNYGRKLYDFKSLEVGVLGGLGYGNLRYTISEQVKPDFPLLFEEPNYDGYLNTWGAMLKPELFVAYALPISRRKTFDLIYSAHFGYELPIGRFGLADLNMSNYMGGPYIQFGFGVRP